MGLIPPPVVRENDIALPSIARHLCEVHQGERNRNILLTSALRRSHAPPQLPPAIHRNCRVRCALHPQERRESRRLVSISLVLLQWLPAPKNAVAGGFDKYIRRKNLEPLESYVPAIILTEMQIKELGKTLEGDQPQYAAYRSVLRAGPAASLRANIRAVAQYASDSGNVKSASNDVDQCLRALEDLDSLLLNASRNDPRATIKSMQSKIGNAVDALDSLLQTVPSDVLLKGKAIADAYNTPEDEAPSQIKSRIQSSSSWNQYYETELYSFNFQV